MEFEEHCSNRNRMNKIDLDTKASLVSRVTKSVKSRYPLPNDSDTTVLLTAPLSASSQPLKCNKFNFIRSIG